MWCNIGLCVAQLLAVCLSSGYGIEWMITVYVLINIGWFFVWHFFARREIELRLTEALLDITPYLTITLVLVVATYLLTSNIESLYLCFALKVLFVATGYCLTLWLLRSTTFKEFVQFFIKHKIE
jgi:hypothetical protein